MLNIDQKAVKVQLINNRDSNLHPANMDELADGMRTRHGPPSTASYLYSVFRGEHDVRLSYVSRIAASLKVSVFDIIFED